MVSIPECTQLDRVKSMILYLPPNVIAGFAIGTAAGWLIHSNPNAPFILQVMPHGIYVGIGKRF